MKCSLSHCAVKFYENLMKNFFSKFVSHSSIKIIRISYYIAFCELFSPNNSKIRFFEKFSLSDQPNKLSMVLICLFSRSAFITTLNFLSTHFWSERLKGLDITQINFTYHIFVF